MMRWPLHVVVIEAIGHRRQRRERAEARCHACAPPFRATGCGRRPNAPSFRCAIMKRAMSSPLADRPPAGAMLIISKGWAPDRRPACSPSTCRRAAPPAAAARRSHASCRAARRCGARRSRRTARPTRAARCSRRAWRRSSNRRHLAGREDALGQRFLHDAGRADRRRSGRLSGASSVGSPRSPAVWVIRLRRVIGLPNAGGNLEIEIGVDVVVEVELALARPAASPPSR